MSNLPPQQTFKPGASVVPATQVEISVSCRNLKDKDAFSKSDPMCVYFAQNLDQDRFYEVGRTEMIKDTLNPDFVKKFITSYFFEELQKIRFELYDVDSHSAQLSQHDFLGRLDCTLGEIVGSPGNRLDKALTGLKGRCGTITVRAEEVANCKDVALLQFKGLKLDKKDLFGKSDPFLTIYRSNEDGSSTVVHRTEVIKNTLNPTWRPFSIKVRVLCNGDYDRSIKFECYDWDSDGSSHDLIGVFDTTMNELKKGGGSLEKEVINPKKKAKKKSYKHSGVISLMQCKIETEHTFLDYIQGGTQLNFTVAVDFTASNGDPLKPTSLHYINHYTPNLYARALQAVGEIIQDYDTDKLFPALGFGARLPPDGRVSHEFFLNGHPTNPYCQGIQGIMEAYQRTLQSAQLYGPTNFSPVINHVARLAGQYQDGANYFVLLILTDGVITDMPRTKEAIIAASGLPLSIIIIGIGEADFQAMEELDADDKRLFYNGRYAERDIVQFVPFRDFIGGRYGKNLQSSQAHLAKEVLAEVPEQVTGFMKKHKIKPKPPSATTTVGPGQAAGGAAAPATAPAAAPTSDQAPPPVSYPSEQPGGYAAPAYPSPQHHGGSVHGGAPPQAYPSPQHQGGSVYGGAPPPGQGGSVYGGAPPPGQGGSVYGGAPPPGQAYPNPQHHGGSVHGGAPPPPPGQAYPGPQHHGGSVHGTQGQAYPGYSQHGGSVHGAPTGQSPYPAAQSPYPGPPQQGSMYGAPQGYYPPQAQNPPRY